VRSKIRVSLVMLVACSVVAVAASAAQAAPGFGVERFIATNCKFAHKACGSEEFEGPLGPTEPFYTRPKAKISVPEAEAEGFTQAGGRVPYGVTHFEVTHTGEYPNAVPDGIVNHVRVDVSPGLATAPVAVPLCSTAEFGETEIPVTGTGLYPAPACKAETEIGTEQVTLYLGPNALGPGVSDLPIAGKVYNLVQPAGLASYYGVALAFPKAITEAKGLGATQYYAHGFVKGSVEWGKQSAGTEVGDYHDYFEVEVSPAIPLLSSRQVLFGTAPNGAVSAGTGNFITNATNCPGNHTTFVTLQDTEKETTRKSFETPIALEKCALVPFVPEFALTPETTQYDQPDGITTSIGVPHVTGKEIDSSQVKTATVTLPEGMTLNPSAAAGLEACTPAQARITSPVAGVACPVGSKVGTATLEVPTLPAGSLTGNVYLGGPESGPITGLPLSSRGFPTYTMYLDAESSRYGISVRVKGTVEANPTTGQVTANFTENPEQPFTNLTLHIRGGAISPIANPLTCGTATTNTRFVPIANPLTTQTPFSAFSVSGCPSPVPFNWAQSAATIPTTGGATSAFTFTLARADGQQYLEKTSVQLPPGLVGKIPTVALCPEPQANTGACPSASKVGTVLAYSGSGTPYPFTGTVYLTGPYQGAPYGLSIVVPVVAGPFNLGTEVTRSKIEVNPNSARVTVNTPKLPTIKGGIPVRLKTLVVAITTPNYILNPTNCSVFQTESTLTSTMNALQNVSTPFQASNCSALAFKPSFKATTTALTSKNNGASLETTLNQPGKEANIKSAVVTLPKAMPSRLTTLQKACPAATFNANPFKCPSGSYVGGARANTPVLPGKMTGPAVLVSHGGAAFPDLDLVLEANGVRVIVVGNTNIVKGITTTSFLTTPDVPVSSITVNLPTGPHSALGAVANFCTTSLVMPTTITGQNGKVVKQNTKIAVAKCPIQVIGRKVVGNEAVLTVETFSAGRVSGSGKNLNTVARHFNSAEKKATIRVPLSSGGKSKGRPFTANVRVGFFPKKKGAPTSVAHVNVVFP
jgi:hypothetical protein